ncbi:MULTISPECIES: hypothetical protein [Haloferax]|uniref:Uncharacterized protein n=1 Tax=Haloferax sp. Atlit-48N TaxID=2077198 RepID=A0ACD5I0Y3_9EURY|nr:MULTISPECIES: hypothetical protein [Haloferax]RDZ30274.1 hypothetical protein DEQ67_14455 [Haloferax sp. Atlit-48N]RDZ33933.1 hypothetical protein C5B88_14770 [Haloferax sp. Atlit-24N]RDZ35602.1 hypothetical protein C5B89_17815 [Haloferax sp. Atlit-47N]RLM33538.1 hypothetical protein DVK03_17835 [Haloferax sp. Atlit-109R]RLM40884.1 hypothetical protein DVK04_18485 [Haloferax sp. Atlit-105R]
MTSEKGSLTSKAELNTELKGLFLRAYENGIDVEGAFECRNGVEYPDWDVIVTEVEKNEHTD